MNRIDLPLFQDVLLNVKFVIMALSVAMVMSGLPREQFTDESQYVFGYGQILLKSPSSSSLVSMTSCQSSDSGISSTSEESLLKSLDYYLEVISNLEQKFRIFRDITNDTTLQIEKQCIKVVYQNRNILDLAEHLTSDWLFQHAELHEKVYYFFGDKPQYSRVNGASIPRHFMMRCEENDCSFNEPKYY